jgi:hypothetical protein
MTLSIGVPFRPRRRQRDEPRPSLIEPRLIAPAMTLDGQANQVVVGRVDGEIALRTGHDGVEVTMARTFARELLANLQYLVDTQPDD